MQQWRDLIGRVSTNTCCSLHHNPSLLQNLRAGDVLQEGGCNNGEQLDADRSHQQKDQIDFERDPHRSFPPNRDIERMHEVSIIVRCETDKTVSDSQTIGQRRDSSGVRSSLWLLLELRSKEFDNGIGAPRDQAFIVVEVDLPEGGKPDEARVVEVSLEAARQGRSQGLLRMNENGRDLDEMRSSQSIEGHCVHA